MVSLRISYISHGKTFICWIRTICYTAHISSYKCNPFALLWKHVWQLFCPKQNDILYQKHYWFPLLTDFGKTLKANVNIQYKSTEIVSLQSGKGWHFLLTLHISHLSASSDSVRRNISNMDQSEKSWKNPEKNLLRQNSQTKEVQFVDRRHAFRIKMTQNRMQIAKFVNQCPGCRTKGLPVPTGVWYLYCRKGIPLKSRRGSVPNKICDLLPAVHFLLPPPISWGMVVPGHLPGSNGSSL